MKIKIAFITILLLGCYSSAAQDSFSARNPQIDVGFLHQVYNEEFITPPSASSEDLKSFFNGMFAVLHIDSPSDILACFNDTTATIFLGLFDGPIHDLISGMGAGFKEHNLAYYQMIYSLI